MELSHRALKALQQMRGLEGGVFNRDMPLNVYRGYQKCHCADHFLAKIGTSDTKVHYYVFQELCAFRAIKKSSDGTWEHYKMTQKGLKALQAAGMDTKKGRLSRDDISWLTGTGRFAQ